MATLRLCRLNMHQQTEIGRLIEDAFSGEPWCDDWHDHAQLVRYVNDLTGNDNSLALGLYEGEALVAIALGRLIHWFEGNQYRIDDLGVRSDKQGAGVGSCLLREIEKYAAENDIHSIVLKTSRRAAAYRFYQKNGFEESPDDVYFEKNIPAKHDAAAT